MRARITLLAVAGVLTLGLAACGSSYGSEDDTTARKNTKTSAEEPQPRPDEQDQPAPAGITIGQTPLGDVLVDDRGRTLYGFTNDTNGTSTCFDACVSTWPAVHGDAAIGAGLDQTLFRSVDRNDGETQLVAGKWPAYTYAGDAEPGDVNGQGSGGVWFVLAPDASLIK
jgi:predicted lipoprotein with Yx(FWY)xxD motif